MIRKQQVCAGSNETFRLLATWSRSKFQTVVPGAAVGSLGFLLAPVEERKWSQNPVDEHGAHAQHHVEDEPELGIEAEKFEGEEGRTLGNPNPRWEQRDDVFGHVHRRVDKRGLREAVGQPHELEARVDAPPARHARDRLVDEDLEIGGRALLPELADLVVDVARQLDPVARMATDPGNQLQDLEQALGGAVLDE